MQARINHVKREDNHKYYLIKSNIYMIVATRRAATACYDDGKDIVLTSDSTISHIFLSHE